MYELVCRDDTWGEARIVETLPPVENFADAKAIVAQSVDMQVRALWARAIKPTVSMLEGFPYSVVVEWKPEGERGIHVGIIYGVEEV